jgi:hypothetical protein
MQLLGADSGGKINTAYIERLHAGRNGCKERLQWQKD